MFWITGKPASGKSTLMNYLASSEECEDILTKSSGQSWLLLNFYFDSRAGKEKANSVEGLLQSVLFQFVQKSPIAARVIKEDLAGRDLNIKHNDMDVNTLYRLIKSVAGAVVATHLMLVLIDGLDEFSGNYLHLLQMASRLVQCGLDKVCLASRPEHLLHQSLVGKPHFKMQDYNNETIENYVTHAIEQISTLVDFSMDERQLINRIILSSEGVILWTRLVTESLLESLLGGHTEDEIFAKMQEFPTELNEAYERLMRRVNGAKQLETALILHLVQTASPLHRLTPRDLHCMLVFLRENGFDSCWPQQSLHDETFLLRLRARTGSMLDVIRDHSYYGLPGPAWDRVTLFHKTLDEYLVASNWISEILMGALPTIELDGIWSRSLAQCVLKYEISHETLLKLRAWFVHKHPKEDYHLLCENLDDPSLDDETLELARIMSCRTVVTSGQYLLQCGIAKLSLYLPKQSFTLSVEARYYQLALGSCVMLVHQFRDRCILVPRFPCQPICETVFGTTLQSDEETLLALCPTQRAILSAMTHEEFDIAFHWFQQEDGVLNADFSKEIMKAMFLLPLQQFQIGHPNEETQALSVLSAAAKSATDDIVSIGLGSIFPPKPEMLEVLAPYLAVNSGDRSLSGDWDCHGDFRYITSKRHNLYLPWMTVRWEGGSMRENWALDGVQGRNLSLIMKSGLDPNEPCCILGPPLHTVVEVCLGLDCVNETESPATAQIEALCEEGADPQVFFQRDDCTRAR